MNRAVSRDRVTIDGFEREPLTIRNIAGTATLPGGSFLTDMRLRISVAANVNANNSTRLGPSSVFADFRHTFTIDGLVPYDADGNILPSNSLVFTTDLGDSIAVLGSDVPEPATITLTLAMAMSAFRRRR